MKRLDDMPNESMFHSTFQQHRFRTIIAKSGAITNLKFATRLTSDDCIFIIAR